MKPILTFQQIIQKLNDYWSSRGCIIGQPYGVEVGAGTANPHTFFRALGPEPYNVAYVEPSRRPQDGRYGQNPNRFQHYFQYQVILKPAPKNNMDVYIQSLKELGINQTEHDLRFVEDNWESAPLGAWGLGWEVWLDGMEISQYTYFQQFAGMELPNPCLEITYGLERIAMYIQNVNDYHDLMWNNDLTYADLFEKNEYWQSKYNFDTANISIQKELFEKYFILANEELKNKNYSASYDNLLKLSHVFNILDARGVVSLADRTLRFKQMGNIAKEVAKLYLEEREALKFPWLNKITPIDDKSLITLKQEKLKDNNNREELLVELGFEEIPAKYLIEWSQILNSEWLKNKFEQYGFKPKDISLFITPRRIIFNLKSVELTVQKEENIKGPLWNICYKGEEETEIFKNFIKKFDNKEYAVKKENINNNDFLMVKYKDSISLESVLQKIVEDLIKEAPVRKFMKWDNNKENKFIRPLRWILALRGNKHLNLSLLSIQSSKYTYNPRYLDPEQVEINNTESYWEFIKSTGIVVNQDYRKKLIYSEVEKEGYELSEEIDKYILLNTYLCERPLVKFIPLADKYYYLPYQVIRTMLEEHQKYLIRNKNDKVEFGIVLNGKNYSKNSIEGYLKVTTARLEDAIFYYTQDIKKGLPNREDLKTIVAHQPLVINKIPSSWKKLGIGEDSKDIWNTYYCKALRVGLISDKLLELFGVREKDIYKIAKQNIRNIKSTMLVKQIPELETKLAGSFIKKFIKDSEEIAKIVDEHYLPSQSKEKLPTSIYSLSLSIADKIDTLVTLAITNCLPSGSNDPYETRKTVYNLLRLFKEDYGFSKHLKMIDLNEIIEFAYNLTIDSFEKESLIEFIRQRIYTEFKEIWDNDQVLRAIVNAKDFNISLMKENLIFLNSLLLKEDKTIELLLDSAKRIKNILFNKEVIKLANGEVSSFSLLNTEAEIELIKSIKTESTINNIIKLVKPLETFFNESKVLDENIELSKQRIALLTRLQQWMNKIIVV